MLKSPVNRIGGKYYLATWLSQYIPQHTLYCEPFGGAGHLLFSKSPSRVEVINDIDSHLVNFFKVIQEPGKCQMLIDRLNYMPYSRSLWQEIRINWKKGNIPGEPVEASAQWFYLNRTCFSGDQKRGGFAVPSVTGRNPAQSFRTAIDTFEGIAGRLRNVTIENLPYAECINRYDSLETLFYCDPPYLDAEHYYGKAFTGQDHRKLAVILHSVKADVMISHYDNELYNSMYNGWYRYEYQSFKGSSKAEPGAEKPKVIECCWTNFKSKQKTLFAGMT